MLRVTLGPYLALQVEEKLLPTSTQLIHLKSRELDFSSALYMENLIGLMNKKRSTISRRV